MNVPGATYRGCVPACTLCSKGIQISTHAFCTSSSPSHCIKIGRSQAHQVALNFFDVVFSLTGRDASCNPCDPKQKWGRHTHGTHAGCRRGVARHRGHVTCVGYVLNVVVGDVGALFNVYVTGSSCNANACMRQVAPMPTPAAIDVRNMCCQMPLGLTWFVAWSCLCLSLRIRRWTCDAAGSRGRAARCVEVFWVPVGSLPHDRNDEFLQMLVWST